MPAMFRWWLAVILSAGVVVCCWFAVNSRPMPRTHPVDRLASLFPPDRYSFFVGAGDDGIVTLTLHLQRPPAAPRGIKPKGDLRSDSVSILFLGGERPGPDDWHRLSGLSSVSEIHINKCPIEDADMTIWPAFKELRRLQISGARLTDAGIASLSGCKKLESLELGEFRVPFRLKGEPPCDACGLSAMAVRKIATLGRLKSLNLSHIKLTEGDIESLAALSELEMLDIRSTQITDKSLETLSNMKSLRKLLLRDDGHRFERNLERDPRNDLITSGAVLELMAKLPDCDVIYFHDSLLARKLREIQDQETLLREGRLLKDDVESDGVLLRFGNSAVTDLTMRELSGFEHARELDLTNCDVSDACIPFILRLRGLRELRVGGTGVSVKGLRQLQEHAELTTLWVDGTLAQQAGFREALESLASVKTVILVVKQAEEDAVTKVVAGLPGKKCLVFAE